MMMSVQNEGFVTKESELRKMTSLEAVSLRHCFHFELVCIFILLILILVILFCAFYQIILFYF